MLRGSIGTARRVEGVGPKVLGHSASALWRFWFQKPQKGPFVPILGRLCRHSISLQPCKPPPSRHLVKFFVNSSNLLDLEPKCRLTWAYFFVCSSTGICGVLLYVCEALGRSGIENSLCHLCHSMSKSLPVSAQKFRSNRHNCNTPHFSPNLSN